MARINAKTLKTRGVIAYLVMWNAQTIDCSGFIAVVALWNATRLNSRWFHCGEVRREGKRGDSAQVGAMAGDKR